MLYHIAEKMDSLNASMETSLKGIQRKYTDSNCGYMKKLEDCEGGYSMIAAEIRSMIK